MLFTVPSRYWSTIGRRLYLALGRGRPRFPPPVTWTAVLTVRAHTRLPAVAYRTLTLCGDPFQRSSADQKASSARRLPPPPARPFNPAQASPAGCAARTVWALPRSLAATRGIISFPRGTKMFQFPRLPLLILYIQIRVCEHDSTRVSPFGYLRFKACLAAPRSFSQPTTSFIGILCQGIHCARLSNFL